MIFWHLGLSLVIARWLFRDPDMDLRVVGLGALLPDIVDKPIGSLFFSRHFGSGRIYAHTLLFSAALLALVLVVTRRGSGARKRWMALPIGVVLHLVLDVPLDSRTLFWPALGFGFPRARFESLAELLPYLADNPVVIVQEVFGLAALAYLWRRGGLADPARRAELVHSGRISL